MRIYRVENKENRGPYYSNMRVWASSLHNDERHPPPWIDFEVGNMFDKESWKLGMYRPKFGFINQAQYRRWFNVTERRKLRKLGFKLVTYEVKERFVKQTKFQVMFDGIKARKKSEQPLR